jgi:hypothetical protein
MAMTEAEWLTSDDPETMLHSPGVKLSERKLRLFACACCRRIWDLIKDSSCRQAVEMAEAAAEGVLGLEALADIHTAAQNNKPLYADASWAAAWSAAPDAALAASETSLEAAQSVARVRSEPAKSRALAASCSGALESERQAAWDHYDAVVEEAKGHERRAQADLLREIAGNPFQPATWPDSFPLTVVQLAQTLHAGEDCAFALHDALLEAGHAELAGHFQDAAQHPRGCWVVAGILGLK